MSGKERKKHTNELTDKQFNEADFYSIRSDGPLIPDFWDAVEEFFDANTEEDIPDEGIRVFAFTKKNTLIGSQIIPKQDILDLLI